MVELEPAPSKEFEKTSDLSDRDIKIVRSTVTELIEDALDGGDKAEFEVVSEDGTMLDKPVTEVSVGETIIYFPNEVDLFVTGIGVDDQKELKQYFESGRSVGFRVVSL